MIHLYYGDGKGKTTAACGLALRAAGSGLRVLFTQFLKDGKSSEIAALSTLAGVTVVQPELYFGWYKSMNEEQKRALRLCCRSLLLKLRAAAADYDLIVLDEAVAAYRYELLDRAELLAFLKAEKENREIVLTGREPASELKELADYLTELKKK